MWGDQWRTEGVFIIPPYLMRCGDFRSLVEPASCSSGFRLQPSVVFNCPLL